MFVWFSFRKTRFNIRLPVVLLDVRNHRGEAEQLQRLCGKDNDSTVIIHISILGVKELPIA